MHVGDLAQQFNLSRSTLLYYEKIGLLNASARTEAGYRIYSDRDLERLHKICLYRETGLSLKAIASILENESNRLSEALQQRLQELNTEIRTIRQQQTLVLDLLKQPENLAKARNLNKTKWIALLRDAGYREQDMRRFHIQFEQKSPQHHQRFLELLNIPVDEIRKIRDLSSDPNWMNDDS